MSSHQHRPMLGISLMIAAMLIFPFLDVVAKFLGRQGIPVIEIVWARLFFGMLLTAPLLVANEGIQALAPRDTKLNVTRGALIVISTLMFFWALKYQGIAETLSIYFVQPLIITALAPAFLGEHVGMRRWSAVAIGFLGVLVIIRPGFQQVNPGVFLAFGAGVTSGIAMLLSRKLAGGSSAMANTFYTSLMGTIFATMAVTAVWQTPDLHQVGLFVLLAAIGTTGNYLSIRALQYAEASMLAPLGYAEMINAVLAGWYFFGDFPDSWTFVGVAILIACAVYISWRERVAATAKNQNGQTTLNRSNTV
jgi:drug/metabolite transporter (DMT)-like permease